MPVSGNVFIAQGAPTPENPVAYIPGVAPLPEGLSQDYDLVTLLQKSQGASVFNRVDGVQNDYTFVAGGPSDMQFLPDRLRTVTAQSRINAPDVPSIYRSGGTTYLAVINRNTGTERQVAVSADYNNTAPNRRGFSLQSLSTGDGRIFAVVANEAGTARTTRDVNIDTPASDLFMVGMSFDPAGGTGGFGRLDVIVPHTGQTSGGSLAANTDMDPADPEAQVNLLVQAFGSSVINHDLAFFAVAPYMTALQMQADYALWQSWLAARGVVIE